MLASCAGLMELEAGRLDSAAARLSGPWGEGRALDSIADARASLALAAHDLAQGRRDAAALLRRAGHVVDAAGPPPALDDPAAGGAARALEALASELDALPQPAALAARRHLTLPLIEAGMLAASPALGSWLLWRAAGDVRAPDPRVSRAFGDGSASSREAAERLSASRPETVSDLIVGCGLVDAMGRERRAVVDIAQVTTADGDEAWIVTLPSTQDWVVPHGDAPAPNDLDAILAHAILPGTTSTYARGVEEAIRQAGIPAGAPVLLVGFSLGGIAATDLARSGVGRVSVEGVVSAGAPIDMGEDPPGVPVLSLVHHGDAVPALDLAAEGDGPLRTTIADAAPEGMRPHSASAYATTAAAHDADGGLTAPYERFLVADPATEVVHRQYEIVER
ncbi:hypothetical protein [Demequina zhanjiangensis]|uniref:Alpha/beta hydrolase n=1 Tax=Demequina zhanjiangensis TaxID=3051659 RepID=A0ABT8G3Z2_9MICO|nr:hypothetical protein [Demequina sp. SYSU T00b26]MDN4473855.1 hypothetical protein [Demequina sp. SYSU T00b26]